MDEKKVDQLYIAFPAFALWNECVVDDHRWRKICALVEKKESASAEQMLRAQKIVRNMAAVETGAIEGLYETTRGFTYTVAVEAATLDLAWETAAEAKGKEVVQHISDQMQAYEYVLDWATGEKPVTANSIRELHQVVCRSQETYLVQTPQGPQKQILRKGEYKTLPNHVTQQDDTVHAYAPVDMTANEMLRLCDEINSEEFKEAHPVLQASYAHFALVAIHPFADGNGRVCRALASAYSYRALTVPVLILSDDRVEYYGVLATADAGDYQPFIDFMQLSIEHSAEIVRETIEASSVPVASDILSRFEKLYVTAGGYTHDQVDKCSIALMRIFKELLNKEQSQISNEHLIVNNQEASGGTIPKGMRAALGGGVKGIVLTFVSKEPVNTNFRMQMTVGVPVDPLEEDEVIITLVGLAEPTQFAARLTDLIPVVSSSVQIRLGIFAQRIFAEGLEHVVNEATRRMNR